MEIEIKNNGTKCYHVYMKENNKDSFYLLIILKSIAQKFDFTRDEFKDFVYQSNGYVSRNNIVICFEEFKDAVQFKENLLARFLCKKLTCG